MTVELIISPPATGKTALCIQRIKALQSENPLAQVWTIVPDRLQAAAFRQRLAASGGRIGVQVGRFPDLYKYILEREGTFQPSASEPLLHRLIQETVDEAAGAGMIPYYQPLRFFPGFITVLRDAFGELKRAMIFSDKFAEYARNGNSAQKDFSVLYTRYQEKLTHLGWTDPEENTWQAVAALQKQPASVKQIQLLIVDGFDSFNGAQFSVLQALAGQVGELVVTFPGVRQSPRPAHRRFNDGIERLITSLSPKVTILENLPYLPPVAAHLESKLFDSQSDVKISTAQPILLEARSPADEAREALRWIKKLVLREGLPLTACVIFTPNAEIYNPLLRSAAAEFGVPIHFTVDDALDSSPAINALLSLLALQPRKFNSHYLINTLRSPYFDFSVDKETVDTFEMISRVGQVVEGRDQWEEVWERLGSSSGEDNQNLADEENAPALPRGEDALRLSLTLRGIFDLITPASGDQTLTAWITWLEDLMERLQFYERAESEQDQTACSTFRDILRALLLSETVAGASQVDFDRFFADLQSAVEAEGFRESTYTGQQSLLVGRFTEARGSRFQAVALLGLSEGSFPVNERPDPFLSEQLRADLGLELRLEREQAGLFYQIVTRADRYLLITRPYLSDDGEEWEESAYWKAVANLLEGKAVEKVRPDDLRPLVDMASTHELLFSAVRRQSLPQAYEFISPRWQDLQHASMVLKARRAKLAGGPFEGLAEALVPEMTRRYPPGRGWSASGFESYGLCPFQFYVRNVLKLEPRSLPELGLGAAQIGTLLHKILELTYRRAKNTNDLEELLELVQSTAKEAFKTAPKEIGFRPSNLWQIEQAQWLEKLVENITALAADSEWQPIEYEAKFGLDGAPPLQIDLGDETLNMHGVIDRVDRNSTGELRVIDYKTGSTHMAKKDLQLGYRLQLPIYALAARDALQLGTPVEGFYWKLLTAEPSSLKLSTYSTGDASGIDAAIETGLRHISHILKGIRAAEFIPAPPEGGCPSYCPAAAWCWRFEPGW